jgi:diguanylate cyclase (GGDEF)-like protein/PAS domain S-box-containing protein
MGNQLELEPFIRHHRRYDDWFEHHRAAYLSELLAVRALLPWRGRGLEIGVGTGRFAAPLGVGYGIDPAAEMLGYARARGVIVARSSAEALPFGDATFDHALIVTTLCFLNEPSVALREARRVIKPDGCLVVGFIDRESLLGQEYFVHRTKSVFYREATFYSGEEVEHLLRQSGFASQVRVETVSRPLSDMREIEPFHEGRGTGAFVVVRGTRQLHPESEVPAERTPPFQHLTDFSAEWLYWRTPEREMRYISPAAADITGYSIDELSSFPNICEAIIHPDDRELWRSHVHEADEEGKPIPIEFRIFTKEGTTRWISHTCGPMYDEKGVFIGISGSNRDVTERKLAEEQLRFVSTHDSLTGVYNRAYFDAEMKRFARGRQFPVSVVMADVDGLKGVNDRQGHAAGDRLLQDAAKVLTEAFRAEDVVARVGGDEFAVLLPAAHSAIVGKILNRLHATQGRIDPKHKVELSLGAATAEEGQDLVEAFHLADRRMYQEKMNKKARRT